MVGLGVGAVALVMAGCTSGAQDDGGGQGYRGARYSQTQENHEQLARGFGHGKQAQPAGESTAEPARGAQRRAIESGRGVQRSAVEPASDRVGRGVADVGAP